MKLPIVDLKYKENISTNCIENIEELIEQSRFEDNEFDYYFEVFEDDLIIVFANLAGYELTEEDIENKLGRAFQVETSVIVKDQNGLEYSDTMYWLGDNDGWGNVQELLSDKPVWTRDELVSIGIKGFQDSPLGFPDKYKYDWEYSLKYQRK